ncbi:MAG: M14 family metallopeptidase [Candidatus Eisenbacteria bacterium]|nr:M14 family metallopeptidase [Candidatus Eisenbacteria bacterium]
MKARRIFSAVGFLVLFTSIGILPSFAETLTPFHPGGIYDPAVPTPQSFLGYEVAAKPAHWVEVQSYFKALAAFTRRVQFEEYGKTFEGRSLFYLVISSEENMQRIDEIKKSIGKLSDPRTISDSQAASISENTPSVVWLAYSVHGDELSSTDAAIQVAYQLAAGIDSLTNALRRELVVIVNPLQNPDGRERFLSQIESFSSTFPNPDNQSLEHGGFWPYGRGNHYLFDLNRDWFILVTPEIRGQVAAVRKWNPQLLVDSHEMGEFGSYLFSPPREPFNPNMTDNLKKWWKVFAKDQARAFDRYGWSYYTREWSELWFPGYASSWSCYTGAVGILYEQAGVQGSLVKRPDGSILTYREAVHHHITSSIANLTTAAKNRKELLKDFYSGKKAALELSKGSSKAYCIVPGESETRSYELAKTLAFQGVEIQVASDSFSGREVRSFWGERSGEKTFPRGSFIIFLNQPLRPLIQAILDFDPRMNDSFLKQERAELEKRGETKIYETTAWSLPMAYNVDCYTVGRLETVKATPFVEKEPSPGSVLNENPAYGFVFDCSSDNAIHAVSDFLEEGCKIWASVEPFKIEGTSFSRGSFLLRRKDNKESLVEIAKTVSAKTRVKISGVNTALSDEGPDLGGDRFRQLELPRIAVLSGNPVDFTSYGALWYLLDRVYKVRFSSLDAARMREFDFGKYNCIILPSVWGGRAEYTRALGEAGLKKLKGWVEDGGTLIGLSSASAFLADTSSNFSRVRLREQALSELGDFEEALKKELRGEKVEIDSTLVWDFSRPEKGEEKKEEKSVEPRKGDLEKLIEEDENSRLFMPRGAIMRVNLDGEHWLSSGMPRRVPAIVYSSEAFFSKRPIATVGRFAESDSLRVSGLLWPEARTRWQKTAYLTREPFGRGQIILFSGEPHFRAYFHGTERLLMNAIFLGPGMGAYRKVPW